MASVVFVRFEDGDYYVASEHGTLGGPYDTKEQADEAAMDFASAELGTDDEKEAE